MMTSIDRFQQALANMMQMFMYKQKMDQEAKQQEFANNIHLAQLNSTIFSNPNLDDAQRLPAINKTIEIHNKLTGSNIPALTEMPSDTKVVKQIAGLIKDSTEINPKTGQPKIDMMTAKEGFASLFTKLHTQPGLEAAKYLMGESEKEEKKRKGLEGIKSLTQGQPIGEQTITAPGATPEPSAFGVQGIQAPPISMEKTTYGKAPISDPLVARLLELSVSDSLPKESWDIIKTQLTPTQIDSYEKGIMAEVQAGRMTLDQAREKLGKGEKQYAPQLKKFVKGKQVRDVDMNKPEDVAKARAEGFTEYERPSERESIGEVSAKTIARKKAQVKVAEEVLGRELTEDEKKKIVIGGGLESLLEQFLHGFGSQPSGVIYDPKSKQMIPAK